MVITIGCVARPIWFLQSVFFRLSAGLNAGAFGYFWLKIVGRKAELMPLLA